MGHKKWQGAEGVNTDAAFDPLSSKASLAKRGATMSIFIAQEQGIIVTDMPSLEITGKVYTDTIIAVMGHFYKTGPMASFARWWGKGQYAWLRRHSKNTPLRTTFKFWRALRAIAKDDVGAFERLFPPMSDLDKLRGKIMLEERRTLGRETRQNEQEFVMSRLISGGKSLRG